MVRVSYLAVSQVDWWKSLSADFSDDREVYDVGLSILRGFSGMHVCNWADSVYIIYKIELTLHVIVTAREGVLCA